MSTLQELLNGDLFETSTDVAEDSVLTLSARQDSDDCPDPGPPSYNCPDPPYPTTAPGCTGPYPSGNDNCPA